MVKFNINKYTGSSPGAKYIGKNELKYLKEIIDRKNPYRFKSNKKYSYCNNFENRFKKLILKKHALLVSSGTAALHCALSTLNVSKNDEIILPAFGWSSDLMAILATKFTPVFCPIDQKLGLDPKKLNKHINKKTKAVIAIHMRGYVCDISNIKKICKNRKVFLIEDCSQCLGGSYNQKPIGSFGDMSIFSFQFNKLITAGEGGLIATNNKKLFEEINEFHDLGMGRVLNDPDPIGNVHKKFGLNYHASDLIGAFLLGQLESLEKILFKLRENRNDLLKFFEKNENKAFDIIYDRKNSNPNNAFLLLKIKTGVSTNKISEYFKSIKLNIQFNKSYDGHNFNSWMKFLKKNKIKYKNKAGKYSNDILNKSFFIEISSI